MWEMTNLKGGMPRCISRLAHGINLGRWEFHKDTQKGPEPPANHPQRHRVRRTSAQLELPHGNLKSVSNAIQMGFPPHLGRATHPLRSHWAHQAPQLSREVNSRAGCFDFFDSE